MMKPVRKKSRVKEQSTEGSKNMEFSFTQGSPGHEEKFVPLKKGDEFGFSWNMLDFPINTRKVTPLVFAAKQIQVVQSTVVINQIGHKTEYRVFNKLDEGRMLQIGYVTGELLNKIV